MRRSFTIAVMLCATLAAGVQAQTNQSGTGGKSLVDLEAQAKAKRKATTASGDASQQQTPPADDGTTATKPKTTAKKPTTVRKTTARTTTARKTTTVARKPAPKPADTAAGDAAAGPQGATAAAAPAAQPAPQPPPADPNAPKIYKAGQLPDAYKFQMEREREKPADKKPVSEGSGANAAPVSDPAPATASAPASVESTTTPPTPAASAVATPASAPASATSAPAAAAAPATAGAPADAAPSAAQKTAAQKSADQKSADQKTAAPATQKAPDKAKPAPAPVRTAAKASPAGSHAWRDRGYISGNVGWQASSTTFSDTRTLTLATGDTEPRHMTTSYEVKAGPMFDIGAGFRLVKNLGVAVSVTRFSLSNDIGIDATVPHPFFFNAQRPVSGTTPGTREELAIHLDAVYVIPGKKLQVAIFGGPTFFNAKQTVVSDFSYNDVYPFDNPPTFTAGVSAEESKSVTGFNVGADIGYFFNDIFGVGGVVRFSRGTFASSIGDLDLGGPQLSAGVRIRLRQGAASKKPKTPPPPPKKK